MADEKKTQGDQAGQTSVRQAFFGDGGVNLLGIGQVGSLKVCPDAERNLPNGTRKPGPLYSLEMNLSRLGGLLIQHADKDGRRRSTLIPFGHIKQMELSE